MHYEFGILSISSAASGDPYKCRAHRMSPQGFSEFWTGDRVNDPLNPKQANRGIDQALRSLQNWGGSVLGAILG